MWPFGDPSLALLTPWADLRVVLRAIIAFVLIDLGFAFCDQALESYQMALIHRDQDSHRRNLHASPSRISAMFDAREQGITPVFRPQFVIERNPLPATSPWGISSGGPAIRRILRRPRDRSARRGPKDANGRRGRFRRFRDSRARELEGPLLRRGHIRCPSLFGRGRNGGGISSGTKIEEEVIQIPLTSGGENAGL